MLSLLTFDYYILNRPSRLLLLPRVCHRPSFNVRRFVGFCTDARTVHTYCLEALSRTTD